MSTMTIIKELKENGQDYEFYPTTREIIEAMYWDMLGKKVDESEFRAHGRRFSMLDIGAGGCKVFNTIKQIAEEQPLLEEKYNYRDDINNKRTRQPCERLANRIFIDKYMVVEKSQMLINLMPKEALVVGVDFHQNTLLDKQADIVFCNPPYSEYDQWTTKIIREANCKHIYLVIPQRWGNNKSIAQALKDRKAKVKIIGNFDFLHAEDRKARAYVSLVKVSLAQSKFRGEYHENDKTTIDPFDLWFNDTFKINAKKAPDDYFHKKSKADHEKEEIKNELVGGRDLVSILVKLYEENLNKLLENYMKLSELDQEIFEELNIDVKSVRDAFKEKIRGLKNLYWQEVFSNLTEITNRLTSKTRQVLLDRLTANTNIDFNESNIRAVVIWVIKNANSYFESQMLDLYDRFTTEEGIKLYKSNKHFVKDNFRFNRREGNLDKYALDYRIILHYYIDEWEEREGYISKHQVQNLKDVIVIARNLGFMVDGDVLNGFGSKGSPYFKFGGKDNIYSNRSNKPLKKGTKTLEGKIDGVYVFVTEPNENGERVMKKDDIEYIYDANNKKEWVQYLIDGAYIHSDRVAMESDIFTTVKGFKNGNCHFQFNQKFMKKFNLEVGRIRGWLKDPIHAAEEMDISVEEASQYWESSFDALSAGVKTLLPHFNMQIEEEKEKLEECSVELLSKDIPTKQNNTSYDGEMLLAFQKGVLFS